MADRPVPPVVDRQTAEQRLAALEQLLQRVEEQALAETPGPREEIAAALVRQPLRVAGLVDVVAALLPKRAEGLDADGLRLVMAPRPPRNYASLPRVSPIRGAWIAIAAPPGPKPGQRSGTRKDSLG